MKVVQAMYANATTAVKFRYGESQGFQVKVGINQGSVLSQLLFIMVMDAVSKEFRVGLPWEFLYADGLLQVIESERHLLEKIKLWI